MMNIKTFMTVALVAISAAVSSAEAAEATGEYRWGDTANQIKVELTGSQVTPLGKLNLSGEVESAQKYRHGSMDTLVAGSVGYPVTLPYGLTVQPFVQLGEKASSNKDDSLFYAVGAKASRQIYGNFSGEVSFRHRESFHGLNIEEDRLGAAVKYAVTKKVSVGVAVYNYSGSTTDHRYGVFYKYNL